MIPTDARGRGAWRVTLRRNGACTLALTTVLVALACAAVAAARAPMVIEHWSPVLNPGQTERVVMQGGRPPFRAHWIAPDGRRFSLEVIHKRGHVFTLGRPAAIRILGGAQTGILVVEDRAGHRARRPLTMESALAASQERAPNVTPYAALLPMAMVTAVLAGLFVIMRQAKRGR